MKRRFREISFSDERLKIVRQAVELINTYREAGYTLTLRQLYYQFVARDLFPADWADKTTGSTNNERSYKKLGDIIADGRLAGLIDWAAIEDRTRNIDGNAHWESPASILAACASQFAVDRWKDQPYRIEVWVEKDALEGVVAGAARALDVQYFSCRGYASMTSLFDAGQRLANYAADGQTPLILHLGDHDPSGIDMSRDIVDRVRMFMGDWGEQLEFKRIALNEDQIDEFKPPPNPAKATDSRYQEYREKHGEESWELDSLDPKILDSLIRQIIGEYVDHENMEKRMQESADGRRALAMAAERWENVEKFLKKGKSR